MGDGHNRTPFNSSPKGGGGDDDDDERSDEIGSRQRWVSVKVDERAAAVVVSGDNEDEADDPWRPLCVTSPGLQDNATACPTDAATTNADPDLRRPLLAPPQRLPSTHRGANDVDDETDSGLESRAGTPRDPLCDQQAFSSANTSPPTAAAGDDRWPTQTPTTATLAEDEMSDGQFVHGTTQSAGSR